jgi:pyruvate kinase
VAQLSNMNVELPDLSSKSLDDLDHLPGMLDTIGFSFVESGSHMRALLDQLAARKAAHLGSSPKSIQPEHFATAGNHACGNGPHAARHPDRAWRSGDGGGPGRLAETPEEILWLDEAVHLPIVWTPRGLETLTKQGTASRPAEQCRHGRGR